MCEEVLSLLSRIDLSIVLLYFGALLPEAIQLPTPQQLLSSDLSLYFGLIADSGLTSTEVFQRYGEEAKF